jgi:hypothetical protein
MHNTFKSQKKIQFEQNTKKTKKSHECVKTKSCPNYIKESNKHKIGSKVHQVNKAKSHMLNDLSHFKNIEQNQEKR